MRHIALQDGRHLSIDYGSGHEGHDAKLVEMFGVVRLQGEAGGNAQPLEVFDARRGDTGLDPVR